MMTTTQNMTATAPRITPAYLRQKRAAEYVGLSEQMLIKMHNKGAGPPRIKKGRAVLYAKTSLDAWMLQSEDVLL